MRYARTRRMSKAAENKKARLLGCSPRFFLSLVPPARRADPRLAVTLQKYLVLMGSERQMDDDGAKPEVDILAMLDSASSRGEKSASAATSAPRMSAPPGFNKRDAKRPDKGEKDKRGPKKEKDVASSSGATERPGRVPDEASSPAPFTSPTMPRSGPRSGSDTKPRAKPGAAMSSSRGGRGGVREDVEVTTASLLSASRALPKRQLWIVRVPAPPVDEDAEAEAERKEARVAALTKIIDDAMETLSDAKRARDEAREAIVPVRERLREVNDELREKQQNMKPLLEVVAASNAKANEVKSLGRELKGVSTEKALQARLDELEHKMNHEPLSVLEQKAVLRDISKLKEKRADVSALRGKREAVEASSFDRETAASQLTLMRSLVGFIKQKQSEVKALFDHYKATADEADARAKRANERRAAAADERRALVAETRALRKVGARDKSEFYRSRRVAAKARELVKRGNVAEAEAVCMEQIEHVHARLAMDAEYRVEYVEGFARQREERKAARARLAEASAEAAEKEKRDKSASEAKAAQKAAADAKAAEKRTALAAKAAEKEKREAAKAAELNSKKAEAEAALAAAEAKAKAKAAAKARRVAEAPVLEPGILATLAARAREAEQKAGTEMLAPPVAADPVTEAKEAEKRRKRAEKKARKKDEKRREKMEATASTSLGSRSAQAVASEGMPSARVPSVSGPVSCDGASVSAVRHETTPASTPLVPLAQTSTPPEAAPEKLGAGKEVFTVPARRPRGTFKTRGKRKSAFGLTQKQCGWIAVAIALVAMCVLAIAGAITGGGRVRFL